jgi:superfamily II DNA/RNA helicase
MLPKSTVWFSCSATIKSDQEKSILNIAGFNLKGSALYSTEIIQTSINRADLTLAISPILQKKATSFNRLYYLLDNALNSKSITITPRRIPKTIVFINSIKQAERLAK